MESSSQLNISIRYMKAIFICPTHFEMSNLTASEMLELDKLTSTLIDFWGYNTLSTSKSLNSSV